MIQTWTCKCGQKNQANVFSPGATTIKCSRCYTDYILTVKTVIIEVFGGRDLDENKHDTDRGKYR